MNKLYSIIAAVLLFSNTGMAQKEGLNTIIENDIKAHMTFFASDELKGRETGTSANEAAALYIKTNLMRMGLKPIPETGDYFQMIPLISKQLKTEGTFLSITEKNSEDIHTTDSILFLMPPSSSVDVSGEIVFAGYGIEDTINGYNDLEEIDVSDKIVLIMTGNPEVAKQEENSDVLNSGIENRKFGMFFRKKPKAVLYVYNPKNTFNNAYESGLTKILPGGMNGKTISQKDHNSFSFPFPVAFITQNYADAILKSTGNSLEQLEDKILSTGKPASMEINAITASIKANVEEMEFNSPNVIGIIEGSDPVLKNECVIYTAHFDHVGVSEDGKIFNGADDNASGSMGILEIAEAYMNLKKKPKRTIVFAWVNAEEKGLYGSKYYTNNPVISMENTVLNINLDMIGRSKLPSDTIAPFGIEPDVTDPSEIMAFTTDKNTELLEVLQKAAKQTGVKILKKGENVPFGSSDHASFLAKGVPAIFFNSGVHSDLHGERDDIDRIDFDKMVRVSKMTFLLGYEAANKKGRFEISPGE